MPENRKTGGWLAGGMAVVALLVALQPKPAPHHDAEGDKKPARNKESLLDAAPAEGTGREGPLKPVWDFLGLPPPAPAAEPKRYAVTASPAVGVAVEEPRPPGLLYDWPASSDLAGYSFRFLVATVPDPADSGFAYRFDQTVEALQRALEVDDYVIDRAWFPWPRRATPGKQPPPRLNESHPGLILFRSTSPPDKKGPAEHKLLALLLVGETPTAGVHKAAFDQAVRVICGCRGRKEEGNRVRVIGPHFSGSATSLRLALWRARQKLEDPRTGGNCGPEPLIQVVCGSASGFDAEELVKEFKESEDGGWVRGQGCGNERAFRTTTLPDAVVLKQLLRFLGDPKNPTPGKSPGPVVVLYEANTGFGQFIHDKVAPDIATKAAEEAAKENPERDAKGGPPQLILVPYPLHISQLRASYTREQLARLEAQGLPRSGRNLPFPAEAGEEREGGHEAVRPYSPLVTAAVNDLVLDNLLLTMAKKRARHVCLVSTDPQDTIFLARLIRDRDPDVQLLAVGGDLLYTHEDYNPALHGMILASTYPLSPSFQRWGDRSRSRTPTRILFSYQAFQGCYNAALVHLADRPPREPPAEKITNEMLDYGWGRKGETDTSPPIWISVVGGNGELVPVRYIPPEDYRADSPGKSDPLRHLYRRPVPTGVQDGPSFGEVNFPNMWFLLFVLFFAATASCFLRTWKYLRDSPWGGKPQELCSRFKQRTDFGVLCFAQILLYGQFFLLSWTPLRAGLFRHDWLHGVVVCVSLVASVLMTGAAWWFLVAAYLLPIPGWGWDRQRRRYAEVVRGLKPLWRWPVLITGPSVALYAEATWWSKPLWGSPDGAGWWRRAGFWLALADVLMLLVVTAAFLYFLLVRPLVDLVRFGPQQVIDFERSVHLSNGVSPLLPRVFFCAALFGWGAFLVKKQYLANHYAIGRPFPRTGSPHFKGLRNLDRDVRSELVPPSTFQRHFWWVCLALVVAVMVFAKLYDDRIPPMDGTAFGVLTLGGFAACSFLLLFTLLQFRFAWHALRKMLRFLALLPIQGSFERLSDKVASAFSHFLFALRPRHSQLALIVQQFYEVRKLFPAFRAELERGAKEWGGCGKLDPATLRAAWDDVERAFPGGQFGPDVPKRYEKEVDPVGEQDQVPPRGSRVQEWGGQTGEETHRLARHCFRVLCHFWPEYTVEDAFGHPHAAEAGAEAGAHPARPAPLFLSLPEDNPIRKWALAAQDLVAMEVIRYLSQFIVQLRNVLNSLTVGSLLLLLAATVYPFFPQQQLLLMLTALAGTTAVFIVTFLVQLNRDELVSRITRSTPNRFTPDITFLHGSATYVLPIVAGLIVQFPFVSSILRSLLDPLFHVLK